MNPRLESGEGRRSSRHFWTESAWILPSRWLAIALLATTALHCCPYPPGFVPRLKSECASWDYKTSRNEIRSLANDLADQLPDWEGTHTSSVSVDYTSLKAAAIKMARAPECVRVVVLESYARAYCDEPQFDTPKASGMFLLLRVLFVPHPVSDPGQWHGGWDRPSDSRPRGSAAATELDLAWPVHADPRGRVLEVDRSLGMRHHHYHPLFEYNDFAKRFRMRTPAEIDALEIRGR